MGQFRRHKVVLSLTPPCAGPSGGCSPQGQPVRLAPAQRRWTRNRKLRLLICVHRSLRFNLDRSARLRDLSPSLQHATTAMPAATIYYPGGFSTGSTNKSDATNLLFTAEREASAFPKCMRAYVVCPVTRSLFLGRLVLQIQHLGRSPVLSGAHDHCYVFLC